MEATFVICSVGCPGHIDMGAEVDVVSVWVRSIIIVVALEVAQTVGIRLLSYTGGVTLRLHLQRHGGSSDDRPGMRQCAFLFHLRVGVPLSVERGLGTIYTVCPSYSIVYCASLGFSI